MKSRILITTADENTWVQGKPVLFLGEWCKRYIRKDYWQSFDSVTVPYHWEDRVKFKKDYLYLDSVYEELLTDLSIHLNKVHGLNYSVRYWRILIGTWLVVFIQIVFDRWTMLNLAIEKKVNGALNAQVNAANVGYHSMRNYRNIDCVIINEKENVYR